MRTTPKPIVTDERIINDPKLNRQYQLDGWIVPKPRASEPDFDDPVTIRTVHFDADGTVTVGRVALRDIQ